MIRSPRRCRTSGVVPPRVALGALAVFATLAPAAAQTQTRVRFSLDFQGPLMGVTATPGGPPITDGDLLVRRGSPFDPELPRIVLPGSFLGAYANCAGHAPGVACGLEINALSFGQDARLQRDTDYRFLVYLSVDEFANGRPILPGGGVPTIFTEALSDEAAADVFAREFVGPGPFPNLPASSAAVADGDGQASTPNVNLVAGLGIDEPISRTSGTPDDGSNLDALDLGQPFSPLLDRVYFSLQGGFPFCNEPTTPNFDAAANQQLPTGGTATAGDILFTFQGGFPGLYAAAVDLGLDGAGRGTDDIDALTLVENGIPGYQPPTGPYSWVGPNATDLLLFSLRCGSRTLGQPDSISGLPMTEGDILIKFDGDPLPGIFIAAESLGLETIARGGMSNDELDAMDFRDPGEEPLDDCNMNGVEDLVDILDGTSMDCDGNGIPDECEKPGSRVCDCSVSADSACGNTANAEEGCANNLGLGGSVEGLGTSSIATDALELSFSQLTPSTFAIVVLGEVNASTTVGNGRLCLGPFAGVPGTPRRISTQPTGPAGSFTFGPGLLSSIASSPAGSIVSIGTTVGFQAWYRDNGGPCGQGSNFTNALAVTLTP
ncbi:MAG: hypothetical protein AAGA20_19375 [Planctomycetota bacterium]